MQNELRSIVLLRNTVLKYECLALMSSASLFTTLGTFIRCKDAGKAKTGTAMDAENFSVSCCVAKDKMLSFDNLCYFRIGRQ